jgi:phosphoglycerate kinase
MSHLGRPKDHEPEFSLAPCAKRLSELIKKPVPLAIDYNDIPKSDVVLLENLRYNPGEEKADPEFVKQLAKLGDVYVNDAFGTAHRAHASTAAITKYFPTQSAAGFLLEKEIENLSPLLHTPKRPFYAIIGGAKISTKIGVIKNLLTFVDALFIGGGMTYSFMKAKGIPIGDSKSEAIDPEILNSKKIYLPTDLVLSNGKIVSLKEGIPDSQQGMDIGPETIKNWSNTLKDAATIFWNGPLGVFEKPEFAVGTQAIAKILAESKAKTIIGGGDSVAAIQQMGLADRFAHLSTGGGASLEFLEFGHLPGIDALTDK